ncbi:ribosome-recycling factor, chloroplastic [Oryza sativa Japonica Group]|uniref:Ribosome-recycling factor, chloroplastic n=3 Tax=Oryza TaxID=4527 RepID=RRFC_ORYSJ|nr:ribosome-recycling factor, chloroplastic [Oryza sativa Japonica Group]XP_052163589.1 ribosome-recycling factor, chloroplastic [Oryza glaberrima]A2YMU2.2 RecName: Full=Ribosome-recycling factor, chloroplastic; Short=RRF; AltName: Full=Protein OsL8; AltName: Full=Ribosome-releasing factor, chloroplastic; Flags: Precursor [Oryza sativa Indica Group]A3BLC3.2 RecName: Full=Ribosome-recycling factor, chloroplastic; Short=RRF; AltName: Full=Protein OsL8; AltName: Full=Ribosome-releasing factor, chlo|eukprot:NP_001060047.1 Os07g0570700 [Oryza sativa Japonica Group]
MPPLHAVSPAAAAAPPRALSSAARVPQRPGCVPERPNILSSSTNFMSLRAGPMRFYSRPLILQNSDKRAVLRHATIEEIEAEKSVIEDQARERMEKAIETVQNNFNTVRTGRANPAMLDRIEVEYYGTPVNLKSIAQINTPDATSLLIQPYDKSSLKLIEKTIVAANLGVTPSNDGEVIRVTVPPLTSDRRKELAKTVAKLAEEGKVAIRNIRRDAIKAYDKLEKEKKLSEDNVKDLSADLQKVTDEYMKKIEAIQKQKEQELMKI